MGTEIKVWQLTDDHLHEINEDDLSASHYEEDLENWIEKDTSLLGERFLVIGRQYDIPDVGCLDLLCIDEHGKLVVVEFKRRSTTRDTIAQILDYASWLDTASSDVIESCARNYLKKSLSEAFLETFETDLQSVTPQNHRMIVVAPRLDVSAERIINYLADRHDIEINAIFFRYARTARGDEVLIRTVLVPEKVRAEESYRVPEADLMALANKLKISQLVNICRQIAGVADEGARRTYGGSFRYRFKGKIIFGVNVAGERRKPPIGELDVWLPVPSIERTTGVPEKDIRELLHRDFQSTDSGATDCIVRLKSQEQAQALVSRIRNWVMGDTAAIGAVAN